MSSRKGSATTSSSMSSSTSSSPPQHIRRRLRVGGGAAALVVATVLVLVASHVLLLRSHHHYATKISSAVLLAETLQDFLSPQLPGETTLSQSPDASSSLRRGNQTLNVDLQTPNVVVHYNTVPNRSPESNSTNNKNNNNYNIWDESNVLPRWMKDYFAWHQQQRRDLTPDNWRSNNKRYLVMQCLTHERCGGTADRLKPIPVILWLAHKHQRILLIRWERPAKLEAFLLPPEGGLDWRVPDWLEPQLGNHPWAGNLDVLEKQLSQEQNRLVVRSKYQSGNAGMPYYDQHAADGPSFAEVYHDTWRTLFTPVPEIATIIQSTMQKLGLTPGNYAAAHLRALYAIKSRQRDQTREWAINAVQCASELRPGGPVYFASDSKHAVDVVQHYAQAHNRNIVSLMHEKEPLHLEKAANWTSLRPSDFYDTFVDLYLLGMSRCLAHNIGGFGQWALMLGYNASCGKMHTTRRDMIPCQWKDADASHPTLPHNDSSLRKPMSTTTT